MSLDFQWHGTPDKEQGVALFAIAGQEHTLALPNFASAHQIARMLREARQEGMREAVASARHVLTVAMQNVEHQLVQAAR